MVIKTTIFSFKFVSRTDPHLGNIYWHANLGWHGSLYDNIGRHGIWDHRVQKVETVFYVGFKDRPLSR